MKGRSNGGGSNLVYGTTIAIWMAILFGCLAMTAQAGRSPHHQLVSKQGGRTTRALYLTSSGSNTTSAYHTDVNCFEEATDDERKTKLITIIFCTTKCYCHSDNKDDICYCCQTPPTQVCYNTLDDCHANCPVCNPTCPDGTTADGGQQLHAATNNATL